jgi:hypothetical protein
MIRAGYQDASAELLGAPENSALYPWLRKYAWPHPTQGDEKRG